MPRKSLKYYRQESEENMRLLVDQALASRATRIDLSELATQSYSHMSSDDLQEYARLDLWQRDYEFALKYWWKLMFPDSERTKRQPHLDGEFWMSDLPKKIVVKNQYGLHCLMDQSDITVDQSEEALKMFSQPLAGPLRVIRAWAAGNGWLRTLELKHGPGKTIGELLHLEHLEAASQTTGITSD